jgi:hypothetical protein
MSFRSERTRAGGKERKIGKKSKRKPFKTEKVRKDNIRSKVEVKKGKTK